MNAHFLPYNLIIFETRHIATTFTKSKSRAKPPQKYWGRPPNPYFVKARPTAKAAYA